MQRFADKRASMTSFAAVLTVASMLTPAISGCNSGASNQSASAPPPMSAPNSTMQRAPMSAPPKQGMSTGKKLAILAGTAALVYLYNKHKNAKGTGEQGQYYRSESTGRIYYRDKNNNAVFVTPPKSGIQVPAEHADIYERAAKSGNYDIPASAFSGGTGALPGPRGM